MALNIKELARNFYKQQLFPSVENLEELLQSVYDQGRIDKKEELMYKSYSPQPHYDNSKGSLYKVAQERGWNAYVFDCVKRLERAEKKGQFKEDLQKTKDLIDIWVYEKEAIQK